MLKTSEIIYVEPNGMAHTIDQAHDIAYKFNVLLKAGIVEWWQEFTEAIRDFVNRVYEAFKGAIEQFRALGRTWAEIINAPEERGLNYRQWQQQEQRRQNRPEYSKSFMKQQAGIKRPTDRQRFRGSYKRI